MALSDQLKRAMAEYGTVYAVARDSGVEQTVLNRFAHGERGMRLFTAERLAEFFGMKLTPSTRKPAPYIPPGGPGRARRRPGSGSPGDFKGWNTDRNAKGWRR
jgi:hypothetical protein